MAPPPLRTNPPKDRFWRLWGRQKSLEMLLVVGLGNQMASQPTSECPETAKLFTQTNLPNSHSYTSFACTHTDTKASTQTLLPTSISNPIAISTCQEAKASAAYERTLWDSLSNYLLTAEELGKFAKAVFAKAWSACKPQSKLIKYEIRAWITSPLIFWSN